MRLPLLAALALIPATATGQARVAGAPADLGYQIQDRGIGWESDNAMRASLQRAGAWGRCVVATDAEGARAFIQTRGVAYRRAEWDMKPVFYDCARQVGAPTLFTQDRIRTAILVDALRAG